MSNGHWQASRQIVERILVCGNLVLETPACFGNGETDSLTDMPLALDPLEGRALLTGTSIAGALRAYLREREWGHRHDGGRADARDDGARRQRGRVALANRPAAAVGRAEDGARGAAGSI